jgi:hypothetical protein
VQGEGFEGIISTGVSFGIPLAAAPIPHLVRAPTQEEEEKGEFPTPPEGCTGNVTKPGAEAGNLCVFAREEANLGSEKICAAGGPGTTLLCLLEGITSPETADSSGFVVGVAAKAKGIVRYDGTWAVTAE